MPTLTHIYLEKEYTIGYTYYHGSRSMPSGTPEDPEDYDIIQIWNDCGDEVSEELFDEIKNSCDMIAKIREDMMDYMEYK